MAMFSKRHYEVVAKAIRDVQTSTGNDIRNHDHTAVVLDTLRYKLVCIFHSDNPRFDAERFNKACEPKGRGE